MKRAGSRRASSMARLTRASFLAYIEQNLVRTRLHRGDIVIADHLGAHKVAGVRRAIERVDATL